MEIGVGLDVGGTKILACAMRDDGEIVAEERVETPNDRAALFDALESVTADVVRSAGANQGAIAGVGAGLPGLVDGDGYLHEAANLSAVAGTAVRLELAERMARVFPGRGESLAIVVENDGTAAAAGELAFGAARGLRDVIVAALGTGIGGGLVANGQLVRGARGFAGEIGHAVVEVDGPPCVCGNRGCWEQFASGTGLGRLARLAAGTGAAPRLLELAGGSVADLRGEHVEQAASEGDEPALEIVKVFTKYLAVGLSNLSEILDPSTIILGGGLARRADVLFAGVEEQFASYRRGAGERRVHIAVATLGDRAGVVGAASLALGVVS